MANELTSKRSNLIFILSMWQIGFTALIFIICIFFSHKIAGPIYKLRKYLTDLRLKQTRDQLFFRKGDYFHELSDEINITFEQIHENYRNDFVYLNEVSKYINNLYNSVPEEKKDTLNEIIKKLSEIQNRYNGI